MNSPTNPLTAEAQRAPQTGATTLTPAVAPKPSTPISASSLAQQVQQAQIKNAPPPPAGLVAKSTKDILSPWMRGLIYAETNARKTSVTALFGSTEDTRIISTRGEDQLIPLRDLGYTYVHADTAAKFRYAMMYPEVLWPDWAKRPNKLLTIDDVTQAKDFLLSDNETDDAGRERKDARMIHREAKADMGELMRGLFRREMHVIAVAFAAIYTNNITREESITPDIPPAMSRMLTADFSFVFFIDKTKWMFVTNDRRETYRAKNDKGIEETHTRITFAKRKLPMGQEGKGVINDLEKMDLQDIWKRIQGTKGAAK